MTDCDLVFFAQNHLGAGSPTWGQPFFRFRFFEAQIRKEESTIIFWYKSIYILLCLVFELRKPLKRKYTIFDIDISASTNLAHFADVFNLNVTHFCLLAKIQTRKQCRLQNLTSPLRHQNPHQSISISRLTLTSDTRPSKTLA